MTRQEIIDQYEVKDNFIVSPGKFEGELIITPYFWQEYLEGGDDNPNEFEYGIMSFTITDEDREIFPEILTPNSHTVKLHVDDNGFIYTEIIGEKIYAPI
jgi:hypothetical protein